MKTSVGLLCSLCSAAVLLTACAEPAPLVVKDTVGPRVASPPSGLGRLVVYSATRVPTVEQSRYPVHTDYTLTSAGGDEAAPQTISNHTGFYDSDPAWVPLASGQYSVKALMAGGGYVIVPVVIEPGKVTVLDLDGTALPQGRSNGDMVRLPNGHAIGWRYTQ